MTSLTAEHAAMVAPEYKRDSQMYNYHITFVPFICVTMSQSYGFPPVQNIESIKMLVMKA